MKVRFRQVDLTAERFCFTRRPWPQGVQEAISRVHSPGAARPVASHAFVSDGFHRRLFIGDGDWIVTDGKGQIQVFSDAMFHEVFEEIP